MLYGMKRSKNDQQPLWKKLQNFSIVNKAIKNMNLADNISPSDVNDYFIAVA